MSKRCIPTRCEVPQLSAIQPAIMSADVMHFSHVQPPDGFALERVATDFALEGRVLHLVSQQSRTALKEVAAYFALEQGVVVDWATLCLLASGRGQAILVIDAKVKATGCEVSVFLHDDLKLRKK